MRNLRPFLILGAAGALLSAAVRAESLLPPERIPLDSFAAFRPPAAANWQVAGDVGGDPRTDKALAAVPGTGVLICNPVKDVRSNLFTAWEHGDLEVDLDFLVPPHSNSGVYLQGRYEVQILDSWGVRDPKYSDCGGIYQRWDDSRPTGQKGYEGTAPRANASRAPGLWQHLHIEFEAPRFDRAGQKTKNARFAKVLLNGFLVQENVEVTGPTRSAAFTEEKALGPLMIQGDHGPVAIRALTVRRLDAGASLGVEDLAYRLYAGLFKKSTDYDGLAPAAEGRLERFSQAAVKKPGSFGLVITGTLIVARPGEYVFAAAASGSAQLQVDDRSVITPFDQSSSPGKIALAAGSHRFRLDYHNLGKGKAALELSATGPGLARQELTSPDSAATLRPKPKSLLIESDPERVSLQRSFVPFEPVKRLYAINVGTPAGVHYAYDFETGAVLRAWRGHWIDTEQMWVGRGNDQVAQPAGPALTFGGKPLVALIEYPERSGWPDVPERLWSSQGYVVEPDGQPVFLSTLGEIKIRDRIAPAADGKGLARTIALSGKFSDWKTWILLAEADAITPQPGGRGWIVGDRAWYLDWPADSSFAPVVQTRDGKQQLVVRLSDANLTAPVSYSIVW